MFNGISVIQSKKAFCHWNGNRIARPERAVVARGNVNIPLHWLFNPY